MELRVLRYFLTVAREGDIAAAARELHLTQSTLSRRIKDLEGELGLRLFDRKGARMHLTADGLRLRGRTEEIVDMLNKTDAEFAAHDAPVAGDIHIGLRGTRACLPLYTAIAGLRAEHPDVHVHLYVAREEELAERLEKGLLDFALLPLHCDQDLFESLSFPEREMWGVYLHKDHTLAIRERLTAKDLANTPLLLPFPQKAFEKSALRAWFGETGKDLDIAGSFNHIPCAEALAATGAALALCPEGTCGLENLCFRPLSPRLETRLCLAWKRDLPLSRPCEALRIKAAALGAAARG